MTKDSSHEKPSKAAIASAAQMLLESETHLFNYLARFDIHETGVKYWYNGIADRDDKRSRKQHQIRASLAEYKIEVEGNAVSRRLAKLKALQNLLIKLVEDEVFEKIQKDEEEEEDEDSDEDYDDDEEEIDIVKAKQKQEELDNFDAQNKLTESKTSDDQKLDPSHKLTKSNSNNVNHLEEHPEEVSLIN